ncbi:metallo-beta-lactamase superfamily protein [Mycobacterium xenopi 4042]|uniref:Metallo-beta-lactamase superfamily protein n=1 Tax=Mycobacterium xenopi 4042 TaxID=1299334 RepID=X8DDN9_MYCXE|nr:metallo-beta-lactamase superfamily protein [Mycobacterium xenopi 4042]
MSLIVTSHQHWDHWQALQALAEATGAPTAAHEIDAGPLPVKPDRLLAHGDTVQIGKLNFDVLHLRGHTPGLSHWRSMDPQPATSRSCSPATACFLAASARRGSPVISRSCSTMSSPGCSTALGTTLSSTRPRRRHHPRCGASALGGVARARLVGPRGTARRHAVTVPKPAREQMAAPARLCGGAGIRALPALAFPAPRSGGWRGWAGPAAAGVARSADDARRRDASVVRPGGYVLSTQYWLLPSAGPLLVLMAAVLGRCGCRGVGGTLAALGPPGDDASDAGRGRRAAQRVGSGRGGAVMARLGGAWAALGTSQWNQPVALASAALGGVWLTSFLLVAVNTAIVGVLMCRCLPGRLGCVVIAVVCAGLGRRGSCGGIAGAEDGSGGAGAAGVIDDGAAREAAGKALTATLAGHGSTWWFGRKQRRRRPASHPDDMRQLRTLAGG